MARVELVDWSKVGVAVPSWAETSFEWEVPPRTGDLVKPVGKLTRAHFVGSPEKRYVDERGQLFLVQFYPRQVLFLCNVTRE